MPATAKPSRAVSAPAALWPSAHAVSWPPSPPRQCLAEGKLRHQHLSEPPVPPLPARRSQREATPGLLRGSAASPFPLGLQTDARTGDPPSAPKHEARGLALPHRPRVRARGRGAGAGAVSQEGIAALPASSYQGKREREGDEWALPRPERARDARASPVDPGPARLLLFQRRASPWGRAEVKEPRAGSWLPPASTDPGLTGRPRPGAGPDSFAGADGYQPLLAPAGQGEPPCEHGFVSPYNGCSEPAEQPGGGEGRSGQRSTQPTASAPHPGRPATALQPVLPRLWCALGAREHEQADPGAPEPRAPANPRLVTRGDAQKAAPAPWRDRDPRCARHHGPGTRWHGTSSGPGPMGPGRRCARCRARGPDATCGCRERSGSATRCPWLAAAPQRHAVLETSSRGAGREPRGHIQSKPRLRQDQACPNQPGQTVV